MKYEYLKYPSVQSDHQLAVVKIIIKITVINNFNKVSQRYLIFKNYTESLVDNYLPLRRRLNQEMFLTILNSVVNHEQMTTQEVHYFRTIAVKNLKITLLKRIL